MTTHQISHRLVTIGVTALLFACGSEPPAASTGTGGASGAGGAAPAGGASGSGGLATGGAIGSGGVTGNGGEVGSGGASGAGGARATGGATGAGGGTGAGGSAVTGGSAGTGGAAGTGGRAGTGGALASGGSSGTGGISATGGATAMGGATGAGGGTHTGVWKVMPLGNSVTGSTCYPQVVSAQLKSGNHTNFQFIGTQTNNQSCGNNAPSVKSEGHGGYGVTYLPQNSTRSPIPCTKQSQGCGSYAELQTWAAEKPDIVLMHYGTNDVWDGQSPANILSAYLAVIAEFRKQNPNVIFFVSKIIKLSPSGCGNCLSNVANLVAAVTDAWASTNSTATSPIRIIDHYNCGFDPSSSADTSDGVHPTLAGATKMATATYNAVTAAGYF